MELNLKTLASKKISVYLLIIAAGISILLLAVLVVSVAFNIKSKIKEERYVQSKNALSVTGLGKVLAKPDIGQIDLSVVSDAKTVAAAQSDNSQKMNKIIEAEKALGTKEEDLKTVNYNIYPQYQYFAGRSSISGYEVTQTLRVKIRDLEKMSQILEKAASLGANQIGSLSFTFDEPEKLKEEARQKAIVDAKQKAGDLAKALGVKLSKIVSFSETPESDVNPLYYETAKGLGGGAEAPQIQTGQNEIEATVTLSYEMR